MDEEERQGRPGGPTFEPPVYRQRYDFVEEIVRKYGAKKVIDFGCSEGKLISKLKRVECIEELVGIDIDLETLEFNRAKAKPFASDFLDPRSSPLTVSFYQGSIASSDERFVNFDVIACVEIIEHLYLPVLKEMPKVVFGQLSPKVVVVTTPNSEFNVLFPGLNGFRHYDHKFEWTRAEFENWSTDAAEKYGYTVSFTGVGDGPPGSEHLGKCSQIAVFLGNDKNSGRCEPIPPGHQEYTKVISCVHPYKKEKTVEECLSEELEYYTLFLAGEYRDEMDSRRAEIPLERFFDFPRISKLTTDVKFLRSVINNSSKLELNEQQTAMLYTRAESEWPSDDEDNDGRLSKWDSEGVGRCYNEYYNLQCQSGETQECWDIEMDDERAISEHWDNSGYPGTCGSQKDNTGYNLVKSNSTTSRQTSFGHGVNKNGSPKDPNWMFWRDSSTTNDYDGEGEDCFDDNDILADRDWTW